jgi:hypothetical protein
MALIHPMVYSTAEIVCPNGGYTSTSTLASLFGSNQHVTDIVTPLLTQDEHQLGDNMASIDVGSNLVSDRRSDNGIPVDMAPGPMEASPGRGGGDVEGDVEISEDTSHDNDISVGANNQVLTRLHHHAWPYVSFVCSADLFIVYAINACLNRCQKWKEFASCGVFERISVGGRRIFRILLNASMWSEQHSSVGTGS